MNLEQFLDIDQFTVEINQDISDLTEAMRTQTARAAYYGILHSRAKKQAAKVALLVKSVDATLTTKRRQELADAAIMEAEVSNTKPEKVTVDMVKAAVAVDPQMRHWFGIQLEADEIETVCRVAYDAFKTRQQMLISLGNLARDQMRTNQTIRSAQEEVAGYHQRRQARQGGAANES